MNFKLPSVTTLDHVLGVRSWGLILYGALPACLSLLGFLEIKVGLIEKPLPILVFSLLPLFVTFLLVRARERAWYFTDNFLFVRSTITTLLIVLCASAIAGAVGIIRQKYVFSLTNLTDRAHMMAMTESFLFGVASLVLSSTLFATILTKDADLPGLPSSDFVKAVQKVRQQLIAIQNSNIWKQYGPADGTNVFEDLGSQGEQLMKDLQAALSQPGNRLAKRSLGLKPLEADVVVFAQSISYIRSGGVPDTILFRWQTYFADSSDLDADTLKNILSERDTERIKAEYEVLQRIRGLRIGG